MGLYRAENSLICLSGLQVIAVLIISSYPLTLIEKRTAYLKIVLTDTAKPFPNLGLADACSPTRRGWRKKADSTFLGD
ncbi:hypothetical protein J2129_001067 [Methanofollis sp. W23]|nr:hypothetical protein [Methanofollis sp. W23]